MSKSWKNSAVAWAGACSFVFFIVSSGPLSADLHTIVVDPTAQALLDAVRQTSAKHQVYANNIANAMTPGYKPLRLPDEQTRVDAKKKLGVDDKVVIDEELAKLGENQGRHDSYLRLISLKRGIVTQIIRQGK